MPDAIEATLQPTQIQKAPCPSAKGIDLASAYKALIAAYIHTRMTSSLEATPVAKKSNDANTL